MPVDRRLRLRQAAWMIRIISGRYKSRMLESPVGEDVTRPYAARVKESVFNLLRGWFEDANVLDLFSGVGTIGLECVSRGAASVLMVEQDRRIVEYLRHNISELGCSDQAEAMHADALAPTCLSRAPAPVDVVFMDPPYAMMSKEAQRVRVLRQASACRSVMKTGGFLVLRSPTDQFETALEGFDGPEVHQYASDMFVLLYCASGEDTC